MNPYDPPTSPDPNSNDLIDSKVKESLKKWNNLRIIYNLVLFVVGMLVAGSLLLEFPI